MSHYEINVAKKGRHYFATHERSLKDEREAVEMLADFLNRFPESNGFSVTMTKYECQGLQVYPATPHQMRAQARARGAKIKI